MSRLGFGGFEVQDATIEGLTYVGLATHETSAPLTGGVSLLCAASSRYARFTYTGANDRWYYGRFRIKLDNLPSAEMFIARFNESALFTVGASLSIRTDGKLQISGIATGTTVLATDTEYLIEWAVKRDTGAGNVQMKARIDGVLELDTSTGANLRTPNFFEFGWISGGTTNSVWLDDWAVNDDQGSDDNSWPGDAQVHLMLPDADVSTGNWERGDNVALSSDGYDKVNNTPPSGAAGSSSVVRHDVAADISGSTSQFDVSLPTYESVIGSDRDVTHIWPFAAVASSTATVVAYGLQMVSNPALSEDSANTNGTANSFGRGVGAVTSDPTITESSDATIRLARRTNTAAILYARFLGAYVEHVAADPTQTIEAIAIGSAQAVGTPRVLTFFDDFNRADSGSLGSDWVERWGDWEIASNKLELVDQPGSGPPVAHIAGGALPSPNYAVEVEIGPFGSMLGPVGVMGRRVNYLGTLSEGYYAYIDNNAGSGDTVELARMDGFETTTVSTVLDTAAITVGSGTTYTLRLELRGSLLRVLLDGVEVLSANDTTFTAAGDAGVIAAETGTLEGITFDNFAVELLTPTIEPSAIGSAEAFGTPRFTSHYVQPSAIGSGESFGSATLTQPQTIRPSAIGSAETFGAVTVTGGIPMVFVDPDGIDGAEALGTPNVQRVVKPTGTASGQAFGTPTLTGGAPAPQTISPSAIASAQALGTPIVIQLPFIGLYLDAEAIESAEAFGTPTLYDAGPTTLEPTAIDDSTATFGRARIYNANDPAVLTPRCQLWNPVTDHLYAWAINFTTEDEMQVGRQIERGAPESAVTLVKQQRPAGALVLSLTGTILDPAQQAEFEDFFDDCDDTTLYFADAQDDTYEVVITSLDSKRVRTARNPVTGGLFYWQYTLTLDVVRVLSGPYLAAT